MLAAVQAQLGHTAEAQAAAENLKRLNPDFPTRVRTETAKFNFSPELQEKFIEGLRKAGLSVPPQ